MTPRKMSLRFQMPVTGLLADKLLGNSRNYMPPILVPSSAKRIATKTFSNCKIKWKKRFYFKSFCL